MPRSGRGNCVGGRRGLLSMRAISKKKTSRPATSTTAARRAIPFEKGSAADRPRTPVSNSTAQSTIERFPSVAEGMNIGSSR